MILQVPDGILRISLRKSALGSGPAPLRTRTSLETHLRRLGRKWLQSHAGEAKMKAYDADGANV
jgi:hypothetical protein